MIMAISELPPRIQICETVAKQDISLMQEIHEPEPIMVFDHSVEARNEQWRKAQWGRDVMHLQNTIHAWTGEIKSLSRENQSEAIHQRNLAKRAMRQLLTQKP